MPEVPVVGETGFVGQNLHQAIFVFTFSAHYFKLKNLENFHFISLMKTKKKKKKKKKRKIRWAFI